ncbi:MAG: flagellar hook-length control protein FliK [Acidobacteriota bacterium]|nr:flagellar hook-length control protein FliK [Acidobacteriota bacterium]
MDFPVQMPGSPATSADPARGKRPPRDEGGPATFAGLLETLERRPFPAPRPPGDAARGREEGPERADEAAFPPPVSTAAASASDRQPARKEARDADRQAEAAGAEVPRDQQTLSGVIADGPVSAHAGTSPPAGEVTRSPSRAGALHALERWFPTGPQSPASETVADLTAKVTLRQPGGGPPAEGSRGAGRDGDNLLAPAQPAAVESQAQQVRKLDGQAVRRSVEEALERARRGRRPVVRAAALPPEAAPTAPSRSTPAAPSSPESPASSPADSPGASEAAPRGEAGPAPRASATPVSRPEHAPTAGGRSPKDPGPEGATSRGAGSMALSASGSGGATPPAAGSAVTAGRATLVEQIAARIARLTPGQSVTVTLDPAELGKVAIRFVRRGKQWKVQLIAERSETAVLLTRDLQRLEPLVERNLPGTRVEVATGGDPQGEFQDGPGNSARGTEGRGLLPADEDAPASQGPGVVTAPRRVDPDAYLDILG